ncbi:hypothetical protein BEWA_045990 [Theileria equi strain WA]|uniref:Uncharacterized protein n=1 Tax=Theileria equi strain WA TaxID=1537102 RepID=L1LA69_THEEQ|nr:hypothetical protein BEWA_045990 [Theileria equi strain WA]EKX72135.1 hypothetical protein BEWA_045990 [Theileria equi strain WA]|eukprot:XP_004831587.1 hypothetical protein BEWA_045990 [Theileria equi strain WA]
MRYGAKEESTEVAHEQPDSEKTYGEWESHRNHLKGRPLKDTTEPDTQPTPLPDLKSKIDSTLFDLEEGKENGIKVLKLKAKTDTKVTELAFDGVSLWQGRDPKDACSLVFFYLGPNNDPVAALYRFKRDGKLIEGYRQFSGGKWFRVSGAVFKKLIGKNTPVTKHEEPSNNEGSKYVQPKEEVSKETSATEALTQSSE